MAIRRGFQSKGLVGSNHTPPRPAKTQSFLCMEFVCAVCGVRAAWRQSGGAPPCRLSQAQDLLVEGLGVGGGSRDVGVAGRLVGAGGELELCENISTN